MPDIPPPIQHFNGQEVQPAPQSNSDDALKNFKRQWGIRDKNKAPENLSNKGQNYRKEQLTSDELEFLRGINRIRGNQIEEDRFVHGLASVLHDNGYYSNIPFVQLTREIRLNLHRSYSGYTTNNLQNFSGDPFGILFPSDIGSAQFVGRRENEFLIYFNPRIDLGNGSSLNFGIRFSGRDESGIRIIPPLGD